MIYCENIVNVILFFYSPQILEPHFSPSFSAMPLSQLLQNFFFLPISAMALPQLVCHFFFFFFSLRALHTHLLHPGSKIGHKKFGIPVAEIQDFPFLPFFFFSLILLVEFRQR